MRVTSRPPAEAAAMSTRDAESLFRTKKVAEIRAVEAATNREIEEKKEELRQLVGKSYRDLIDSADTIVLMKTSCESISSNLGAMDAAIRSLSALADAGGSPVAGDAKPARARVYGIACRVKYLVDTSENIWGCLDESMFLEASGRYLRAWVVHGLITGRENAGREVLAKFPILRQLWANVGGLKNQISRMSRERLMERGLAVGAYADALSAVAIIDDLDPKMALSLFLDSRRSWISQKLGTFSPVASPDPGSLFSVLCDVARIIRSTLGQVGELFLHVLNDLPLFYKTVLGTPPGTQLFGGIPNPEEEVKQWKLHREKLESVMVILDPDYVAQSSSSWLKSCCAQVFGTVTNKRDLTNSVGSGEGLATAEKLMRETLDCREDLEGSLEQWLKNVFGSDVESPWNQIRSLILKEQKDILENMLEEAFVERMKQIVSLRFEELNRAIDLKESVQSIVVDPGEDDDFSAYLRRPSTGGGVWFSDPILKKAGLVFGFKQSVDENDFRNCLNAYLGPEVSRIRDALDNKCGLILEDLLSFIDSNNSTMRLQELAPFLQDKCFTTMSDLLKQLEHELGQLCSSLDNKNRAQNSQPPSVIVKRSLFIGRLLFAFRNHSSHIPLILGSPRQWVKETGSSAFSNLQVSLPKHSKLAFSLSGLYSPRKQTDNPMSPRRQSLENPRRQTISAAVALFPMDDSVKPKLNSLMKILRDLCVKAHSLWVSWVSEGLATILSEDIAKDDALSFTTSLRGWEVTMIKQEESSEGPLEMKIALPSMPSLYVTSFLFQACQEVHGVGGHVLDKSILQMFAWRLLEKFVVIYEDFLSTPENQKFQVSEKGILQILLDLRFTADVLSGGKDSTFHGSDANVREDSSKIEITKAPFRRKQSQFQPDSALSARVVRLINELSQRLDPIDWATYEPYLWENEKQSYKRYAVLFGFLVQLNRMYTDVVQKLPTKTNTESNILRCSTVPRFKYLPISGPIQSAKGAARSPLPTFPDDGSRGPWKAYANGERSPKSEFDDTLGFGVATPLFKSFMTQVGSKFGESTSRLGSMLTDAQVGKFKDRSAAAMSTFGDMLPVPGVGLLSSFTTGAAREF